MRGRYEVQAIALMEEIDARSKAFNGRIEADVARILSKAKAKRERSESALQESAPGKSDYTTSEASPVETKSPPEKGTDIAQVDDADKSETSAPDMLGFTGICAQCNASVPEGSKFCDVCGSSLEVVCPSCGTLNRNTARFCKSCGDSLGAEPT